MTAWFPVGGHCLVLRRHVVVNGNNYACIIQLTKHTHPDTTLPGDFDFIERSLTNQTFVTETAKGACLCGCPEWSIH